ncbi:unnamed protein product [Parnassius apollo]|uniref:(apollo) hypothetical protein n=1 Tax=Parnassius apollo TaxID=110799 RepID=A0A8S3Y3J5_PARAO|nr:unnamed protein product [Parnassius apollo]
MSNNKDKVKLCVGKALIDLGLDTNSDYSLSAEEYIVLRNLDRVFQPIKLAVEVLCRRDSDLVTAETTLRFMIRKLEELMKTLARKLAESLRSRIAERQTCLTSVLIYLRDYVKYEEDLEEYARDEVFKMS